METSKSIKNLAAKMIEIMDDVAYIQKSGVNSFHKYRYATEADVALAFSEAFRKHNVCMFSSVVDRQVQVYQTRGGKNAFLVTVKLEIMFVDADSGESHTISIFGDGTDSDDKAVYKAISGAQKYALLKTFSVATGDDPEEQVQYEAAQKAPATAGQVKEMSALLGLELLDPATIAKWLAKARVSSFDKMTSSQISGCISLLEKKKRQQETIKGEDE